jgi:protein-S-isoprenylcysteine O-methyltransferase Ste14
MDDLGKRTWSGLAKFLIALAVMIFLPAWSLTWWQGWLFFILFGGMSAALTLYFLRRDPALVARRLRAGPIAEHEPRQKLIQTFTSLFICALFIVSALDHLFGWSSVPTALVIAGNALVLLGYGFMVLVLRENSFASAIVEVSAGQRVIDTGPYAIVRHPMYAGALLMFLAVPVALGSWVGLIPGVLFIAAIVWRLIDEEAYLSRNLAGYEDYRRKVSARLVPGIW